MIDDIRARVADIEARFVVRAQPPAPEPTIDASFAGILGRGLDARHAGSTFTTLGDLWNQVPATLSPVAPAHRGGSVPAGADRFSGEFARAGARYGVDPALLTAVAWTESAFNPDAVSHAGALGLMQIMPGTAAGLGVDPRDPVQAIDGAARYLREQMDRFGDVRLALAAYNAGPGAVQKHGGIPPYDETIAYVGKVLGRYDQVRSAS